MKNQNINWRERLTDSSKALVDFNVSAVRERPEMFDSLFDYTFEEDGKFSPRAARVVYYLIKENPEKYTKYYPVILDKLPNINNLSIKFGMLHVFSFCPLPEDEEKIGFLTNFCFDLIESKQVRIALKIYALDVLYRISGVYPENKRELIFLIDKYSVGASPAFLNRGGKYKEKLKREISPKENIEVIN